MVSRLVAVLALVCVPGTTFATEQFNKISADVELVCTTKLKAIDWVLSHGHEFTVNDQILQWTEEYTKFHKTHPNVFGNETKIDVERIIREVDRNRNKLNTSKQKDDFITDEIRWCLYYKH